MLLVTLKALCHLFNFISNEEKYRFMLKAVFEDVLLSSFLKKRAKSIGKYLRMSLFYSKVVDTLLKNDSVVGFFR